MASPVAISDLTPVSTPDDADLFAVDQDGVTKKETRLQIRGSKVYRARLAFDGVSTITPTVFENTIGTINWLYDSPGGWEGDASGFSFPANTIAFANGYPDDLSAGVITAISTLGVGVAITLAIFNPITNTGMDISFVDVEIYTYE